jgi:hypothetical protein
MRLICTLLGLIIIIIVLFVDFIVFELELGDEAVVKDDEVGPINALTRIP